MDKAPASEMLKAEAFGAYVRFVFNIRKVRVSDIFVN
jgi:hypothetical protein